MRHSILKVGGTVAAAVAVLVVDVMTPLGLAVWILQIVLVWVTTLWSSRGQLIAITAVCTTCSVLGLWLSSENLPVRWIDEVNLLLGLGVMVALAWASLRQKAAEAESMRAAHELAESRETVRVLRGLLPVCSWCKKIRTEGGTWEQMEVYIRERTYAEFTHGICEECATRVHSTFNASSGD